MLTSIGGGGRLVARRGSRLCPWRCALTPNPAANRIIILYILHTLAHVHIQREIHRYSGAAIQMPSLCALGINPLLALFGRKERKKKLYTIHIKVYALYVLIIVQVSIYTYTYYI